MAYNIKDKLANVIGNNHGFGCLKEIAKTFAGEAFDNCIMDKCTISEIMVFKFAPITRVDVEWNFSMHKSLFRSNRQSLLFENLSEMFVIYCNQSFN